MKTGIYRFKTIEEADEFNWRIRIEEGLPYWEFDRYEYARFHILFDPGVYKFKSLKEKEDWEFNQVCEKWKKQG